ncbi:MAG: MBL fold metallo-hydrolase [Candidatus Omnitrophica bacterium]|nr:MBL fold metallo-hydrolase [Candidatus Omnitrophota bacterium]MCM8810698.1 MBL fold metallo-hydrolase [Candidatus Omnitrophota bacterium]MCM8832384.1 MBL fold metallo-hydrolase [Candidatus Omnitrophota bacterium]
MHNKILIERIIVGNFFTNCYIIGSKEENLCAIVDPGDEGEKINRLIDKLKLKPLFIINTHGHFDHIGANDFFNLPIYIHKDDFEFLKNPEKNLSFFFSMQYICKNHVFLIEEKDIIKIGKIKIEIIHTPGHTPGSICLKVDNILFTGDTIFADGIGRTDFPDGDEVILIKSIKEKLITLPDQTFIFPGHGELSNLKSFKNWFYKFNFL